MPTFAPFTVDEKTFPLLAKLQKLQARHSSFKIRIFTSDQVDPTTRDALAYFAASMFWRGSVYPWAGNGSYPVKLGRYEEAFRQYLRGESGFPTDAVLSVTVREPSMIWKHTHNPITVRVDGALIHKFVMPGFVFHLYVGQRLDNWLREVCFVRGVERPLVVGTHLEQGIGNTASLVFNADSDYGAKKLQTLTQRQGKASH